MGNSGPFAFPFSPFGCKIRQKGRGYSGFCRPLRGGKAVASLDSDPGRRHRQRLAAVCPLCVLGRHYCLFFVLANWCGWNYALANVAAWVVYVVAAYFTNRWFVFHRRGDGAGAVWRGLRDFAGCRLGTCVLETALMALLVSGLGLPKNPVKIGASALSATINYIVSRFWIFSKVKREAKKYTDQG